MSLVPASPWQEAEFSSSIRNWSPRACASAAYAATGVASPADELSLSRLAIEANAGELASVMQARSG